MSNGQREQLLERIRKLLDRAKRDTGIEARRARDLARQLMQRHGITAADVELVDNAPHVHFETAVPPAPPAPSSRRSRPIPVRVKVGKGIEIRFEL